MVIRRTHTGCGIRNPVAPWTGAALALAYAIFWPAFLLAHTWLAFLGYLPWAVTMAALIRWECVHSPAKVYRTWWP